MNAPIASAAMLIRRPPAEVFQAFVDPAITTRFWFSKSSGTLAPKARVHWSWEMYGASTDVQVRRFEQDALILMDWDLNTHPTEVEWRFTPKDGGTFVEVENRGFAADEQGVCHAIESATGFTLVLAGAKIWLERKVEPNFVVDRHPDAVVEEWKREKEGMVA